MSTGITPLTPDQIAAQEMQALHEGYIKKLLVGLDMFVNVSMDGSPDETISSRAARWATNGTGIKRHVGILVSKGLDLVQKDHGAKAEAGDLGRGENVVKIETEAEK
jgi:hypothetical protein